MRHFASFMLSVLVIALGLTYGLIEWGKAEFAKPGPLSQVSVVEVPSGGSVSGVSELLEDRGIIESARVFRLGWQFGSVSEQELKAGVFRVPPHASMAEIVELLSSSSGAAARYRVTYRIGVNGLSLRMADVALPEADPISEPAEIAAALEGVSSVAYRVTIPEGLTSWQIVEGLKAIDILDGEVDEVPPEGSLAPNTWDIAPGGSRTDVLERLAREQTRLLAAAWEARAPDIPLETPEQALILASIIEKETGVAEERDTVSGVFHNRLRNGMRLQTDPTVIYGITRGEGVLGRGLTRSELDTRTPWNTYVIYGLPPTPIANPGRAAIEAAVNPEATDYLYFVADGTGGHAFAETLAEHEANVAVWRQIEAERANQ